MPKTRQNPSMHFRIRVGTLPHERSLQHCLPVPLFRMVHFCNWLLLQPPNYPLPSFHNSPLSLVTGILPIMGLVIFAFFIHCRFVRVEVDLVIQTFPARLFLFVHILVFAGRTLFIVVDFFVPAVTHLVSCSFHVKRGEALSASVLLKFLPVVRLHQVLVDELFERCTF